jgi:hypothetical protein
MHMMVPEERMALMVAQTRIRNHSDFWRSIGCFPKQSAQAQIRD